MAKVVPFSEPKLTVLATLQEFEAAFARRCDAARIRFASQDEKLHAELDMELTTKIDDLYSAALGTMDSAFSPGFGIKRLRRARPWEVFGLALAN
jgi:hypothetical protein